MRRGIAGVFVAALLVGLYLVWVAGWGVFFVGIVCIVAAITYSGGPWPYGYHGLGDPMVFLFFGVVAVVGTSYVETLALSTQALVASVPVGLLATAILVVNNLRDIDTDRVAGKRTLAVRLGPGGARAEYIALLAVAYGMLPGYWLIAGRSAWVLLPLLTLPIAWKRAQTVLTSSQAEELTGALAGTAQLGLVFSVLLALGWVL
jgi:1,4-dihydroxy-2-naphthoate octaprenyltransferase